MHRPPPSADVRERGSLTRATICRRRYYLFNVSRTVSIESERLRDFAAALTPRLADPDALRLDELHRALYATDASLYRIRPLGVLVPRYVDEVQAALEEAARFDIPVVPRGSGSSLAGSAMGAGLVVDTTRLNQIVDIDPKRRRVTVQPGVVLDDLNVALAPHGLRFGPDPASSSRATLGGMVGTNATGTHSIKYGAVVDHVDSVQALLAGGTSVSFNALDDTGWDSKKNVPGEEGELYRRVDALLKMHEAIIRRDTPRHWRRAGGYRLERLLEAPHIDRGPGRAWDGTRNLAHLLCGSEGTLAFSTEITLNLVEQPAASGLAVVHFDSRRAALEATAPILETNPAAVELFEQEPIRRARSVAEFAPKLHFVQGDPAALLIVEYDGGALRRGTASGRSTQATVRDGFKRLRRTMGANATITLVEEKAGIADVMDVRKAGLGLIMSARLPIQAAAIIEDAAVPVEHLPDYVSHLEEVMEQDGIDSVMYAHASAGCLHVRPFFDLKQAERVGAMERLARASAELVKEYGGLIASEHGDGIARGALAREFYGEKLYAAYRATKQTFDPDNLLNPDKITEVPPLTENLRIGPDYAPQKIDAGIAFPQNGVKDIGFTQAIEACNGNAACRKRHVGTMCPPFMASGEEKDSTRGRANALREALTRGIDALTGPEVAAAMETCVACKACQAECPASVDMARLKSAWLAEKWKTERPPLRTRLLADLPRISARTAGRLAPLANRLATSAVGRAVRKRIGLAPDRPLPPFTTNPFPTPKNLDAEASTFLFVDTFGKFMEPEIPTAALEIMKAVAERSRSHAEGVVGLSPYVCCGRTAISEGFLDRARKNAERLVEVLGPAAERGAVIVGLEPSCILTLRDELPALLAPSGAEALPGNERAKAISQQARTFEEWASENLETLRNLEWEGKNNVLVHGHCHQKALSKMEASHESLSLMGGTVTETGAGCCGMAGGFGYEAAHADMSHAIAEDRLAPAVRACPDGTTIAAAGTSCRHQIADVTGREAVHPAVALARGLRS